MRTNRDTKIYRNKYWRKTAILKIIKEDIEYYTRELDISDRDSHIYKVGYLNALKDLHDNLKKCPCDEVQEVIG